MKFHNRVTSTWGIKLYKPGFTIKKILKKKFNKLLSENKIVNSNHYSVNNFLACMQQVLFIVYVKKVQISTISLALCVVLFAFWKTSFHQRSTGCNKFFPAFFTLLLSPSLPHTNILFAFTQFQYVYNQQYTG